MNVCFIIAVNVLQRIVSFVKKSKTITIKPDQPSTSAGHPTKTSPKKRKSANRPGINNQIDQNNHPVDSPHFHLS